MRASRSPLARPREQRQRRRARDLRRAARGRGTFGSGSGSVDAEAVGHAPGELRGDIAQRRDHALAHGDGLHLGELEAERARRCAPSRRRSGCSKNSVACV